MKRNPNLPGQGPTDASVNADRVFGSFPVRASVALPFEVITERYTDVKTNKPLQIRNGGYGSAVAAHPLVSTQFYALTDRGPNADTPSDVAYGTGKIFPVPEYNPHIKLFEVRENGVIEVVRRISLKRPDGTPITGLPNSAALGGTGETPYHIDGSPILVDQNQPYDALTNPFKLDDYGLDGEGLVALRDGTFWVSDEYGPHMVHFDAEGVEIDRINPFPQDSRTSINLPPEYAYRRANRGMEGLAITPDEKTLVGIMQSTMDLPNGAVNNQTITRIVTVNLETGQSGQYLYRQEKNANSNAEIVALSEHEYLVLEHDGSSAHGGPDGSAAAAPQAQKTVYRIDLRTGTNLEQLPLSGRIGRDPQLGHTVDGKTLELFLLDNERHWSALAALDIRPVGKELVLDMVQLTNYPHEKMEGLWLIDDNRLGVVNDDDFGIRSSEAGLEQKMLDARTIDGSSLYIIDGLDLAPR